MSNINTGFDLCILKESNKGPGINMGNLLVSNNVLYPNSFAIAIVIN